MTKPAFFPQSHPIPSGEAELGRPLETFWCTGGQEGAELPQALLQYGHHETGCTWFSILLPWVTLRHGPVKSDMNGGARSTSSIRNSCYQQIMNIPPKYQS